MRGHIAAINAQPKLQDLLYYCVNKLDELVNRDDPKVEVFREMYDIVWLRAQWRDGDERGPRIRLEIRFHPNVRQVLPLDPNAELWIKKRLGSELVFENIEQNDDGGGYIYYTIVPAPQDAMDQLYSPPHCEQDYWWDGGEWHKWD